MKKDSKIFNLVLKILSYLFVALIASGITCYALAFKGGTSKLVQLEALILDRFIGDVDKSAMEDAAAEAMVDSLGDQWSYYIPADAYNAHKEQMENAYVGIGITVSTQPGELGFEVLQTEPSGGALEAGIRAGDVIVEVEGQNAVELGVDSIRNLIRGKADTSVSITVLRGEERITMDVVRRRIEVQVANGEMLEDNIGLVTIYNFDKRCAQETIAAIDMLVEQGAEGLIFDVRFNPGGYKTELVQVLDYLLPEGTLFRSQFYTGEETVDTSDEACLELPMAVLINGSTYSAAEFFAAALDEYDWAVLVGQPTTGKSYFQHTIELNDGSAVGLSVGKYFTPNGISLAQEGGLQPDIVLEVDKETAAKIYAKQFKPADDPQIQAAVSALRNGS